MFFSFKNPLTRRLTNSEMHDAEQKTTPSGAFVGASLINKQPVFLNPREKLIRISGNHDTFAGDVAIKLMRKAVEEKKSILMLDFQTIEEFWHKFWAMCFYLDRVQDFRLIDFSHQERSDTLSPESIAPVQAARFPQHLFNQPQPFSPVDLLRNQNGLIAVSMFGAGELECDNIRTNMCALAELMIPAVETLVIYGWDQLQPAQQQALLKAMEKAKTRISTTLVQFSFPVSETDFSPSQTENILFRQRNTIPEKIWNAIMETQAPKSVQKIRGDLTTKLNELDDMVGLFWSENQVDLLQIPSGEGLPWPPEYKPLRHRA